LIATLIEDPIQLQQTLQIPAEQYQTCQDSNIPTSGNAAGNLNDPLDLSDANVPSGQLPSGFTSRGIVAMVFSCIAAFLGMAVIVWYGYMPLKG
jgi:iron transport multicopper oxidase